MNFLNRCLVGLLLVPQFASAAPAPFEPGRKMVALLTRATLLSSRHDCRYGVYRMSARNQSYLNAVLTGLQASKIRGVSEGVKESLTERHELSRLALFSHTFSGNSQSAMELGLNLLREAPPHEQVWVRLALVEAARVAWRADLMDAQLEELAKKSTLEPLARFLVTSLVAERRAQRQPPTWAQACQWHDQAWRLLKNNSQGWPVGSGHFLAQALSAWSEILLQAAHTPEQSLQAGQMLEKDMQGFARHSNPEVVQAWIFERLNRVAQYRERHQWDLCQQEVERVQLALEQLSSSSLSQSQEQVRQVQQVASEITQLAAGDPDLTGRGLDLMAQNLKPNDVAVGELSRLECAFYREWARLLLYAPAASPERLKKARMCLELSELKQMQTMLTQSPLATVDAPLFDMVELELRQRQPGWEQRATSQAQQGVDFFEQQRSAPGLVAALTILGEAQLATGDPLVARRSLQRAVDRAEEHVVRFGYTGAWANRFRQRYRRAYELLLGLEVEAGHHGPAVDLLSQFQQMQIANLRHDALAAQAMPVPPPRLRGGNQPLSNELPPQGGPSASSTVARGKGEFFQALSSLRQKHPEYDALLAVRPVNYAQIQKWIPDDTAVVQFFPSTDTLYLFWVTARDFKIHKVNLGSQELKRRVSAFRRATTSPSMAQEAVEKASSELYQCLIQPVESELVSYSTVAFVPTGTLSYVPFQALGRRGSEGKFHYLVESKACLTLLKSAELELLSRPAPAAAGRVLALGDPDGSLPAAGVEAQKVAALFEGSKSYVGATASRDKVEGLPAQTRLLHLATHGQLDGDNPTQSYLVMGGAGRLCVADIYALPLAGVRLVTLSACQTALAQRDPGSEVTSLADAFEVAGANSVIATLWSVDDEATQQLMLAFYAQVKQGKSLAEALRAAQLELIGQGRTQAPFYWAAFCLYGDWR